MSNTEKIHLVLQDCDDDDDDGGAAIEKESLASQLWTGIGGLLKTPDLTSSGLAQPADSLQVMSKSGKTKRVVVKKNTKVRQVKEVLASEGFGDPDKQKLMLGDTEMLDDKKMKHYDIQGDAVVWVEYGDGDTSTCGIQ